MKHHATLFAALLSLATPVVASNYELLIVACNEHQCESIGEKAFSAANGITEFSRNGLRVLIERVVRRTNEEDARVSLNVSPTEDATGVWRASKTSLAHRMERLVVQCTLKQGAFSPLTSFVSAGTTYQIWARLAAMP